MVQEISFEDISYLELCQPLFEQSKTICAILVEGIMRNISVKLILNLDKWFRRCHLKKISSKALTTPVLSLAFRVFVQFG